jgi:hypothetical protein
MTPTPVDHVTQYLQFAGPIILALMAYMFKTTKDKLNEIHVLVNSRLTEALAKIDLLEGRLQGLTGERPTGEPPAKPEGTPLKASDFTITGSIPSQPDKK